MHVGFSVLRVWGSRNLPPALPGLPRKGRHGMFHTFTQLLYHIVFGTQYREELIDPDELRQVLYPFIAALVREERCSLLAIGGMPDHVHLLVRARPSVSVSDLLRVIKANSSRWVHERTATPRRFGWQE